MLTLLAGCAGKGLVPVAGTVTLDGQPLAGATLSFLPEEGAGRPAVCLSGSDGSFRLVTNNDPGARPGKYRVVVVKDEPMAAGAVAGSGPEGGDAPSAVISDVSAEELAQGMSGLGLLRRRSLLPARYSDPAQTPLHYQVPSQGISGLEIKLTVD